MDINALVRPNIRELHPYASARDEFSGEAGIFLDANENPYNNGLNRYPDPLATAVKQRLATLKGVAPEQICLGNGSDEIIDLVIRIFCEPGRDEVLILPPTYGMYRVAADISDVAVREVMLSATFQLDAEAVLAAATPQTKVLWLCSPNNPSGNDFSPEQVEALVRQFPGIVVVDEAYIDFANRPSYTRLLAECPNLLVMQTFSKAWGLASIRLGMALASAEVIAYLNKVKPPYNVNQLTQQAALTALEEMEVVKARIDAIIGQRALLQQYLGGLNFVEWVFPSDANFLLVKVREPRLLYAYLLSKGIIVRDRSKQPRCEGCLRITVGTPEENESLWRALLEYDVEQ